MRPLPDKWHGLTDTDTRFRQRYADLIVNEEARRAFEIRHAMIASFRRTLHERGFIEVETPVLHVEAGGAHARPFATHHNTLDLDLYLRIALELHLKRLIVGGMERVFEIGRIFRNEGMSTRHNPEFTMMELYQAFADWNDVMEITEELITQAALDATGTSIVTIRGHDVDLAEPWPRVGCRRGVGQGRRDGSSVAADRRRCGRSPTATASRYEASWGGGKIIESLFEELCEADIVRPTFVTGHPVEISPLARVDRNDPLLTERFELFVDARELANGYSELNDPVEQRLRFEEEQAAKDAGDAEAGTVDEDYLRALEYGMPPTGGLGIGMDRVVDAARRRRQHPGGDPVPDPATGGVWTVSTWGGTHDSHGMGRRLRDGRRRTERRSTPGTAGSVGASTATTTARTDELDAAARPARRRRRPPQRRDPAGAASRSTSTPRPPRRRTPTCGCTCCRTVWRRRTRSTSTASSAC